MIQEVELTVRSPAGIESLHGVSFALEHDEATIVVTSSIKRHLGHSTLEANLEVEAESPEAALVYTIHLAATAPKPPGSRAFEVRVEGAV